MNASASPRLMPRAVKDADTAGEIIPGLSSNCVKFPTGSASRTYGGMVKVPALAATRQFAIEPIENMLSSALNMKISTFPVEPLPFQVTVRPLERVNARLAAAVGLSSVGDWGIVKFAVKAPTSAPPVPVIVYAPGTRKAPAALRVTFVPPPWTAIVPFGPLIVKLEPPSNGAKSLNGGSLGPLRLP